MRPVVALDVLRKAGQHSVAVLFAPNEHLASGVGILGSDQRGDESSVTLNDTHLLRRQLSWVTRAVFYLFRQSAAVYQRIFEVHEPAVIHREPSLLEALRVLRDRKGYALYHLNNIKKNKRVYPRKCCRQMRYLWSSLLHVTLLDVVPG